MKWLLHSNEIYDILGWFLSHVADSVFSRFTNKQHRNAHPPQRNHSIKYGSSRNSRIRFFISENDVEDCFTNTYYFSHFMIICLLIYFVRGFLSLNSRHDAVWHNRHW